MRLSLSLLALLLAGPAIAHAILSVADPAPDSAVATVPQEVTLDFSEAVELRFSTFKVYRLPVPDLELSGEPDARDWLRLNGLAAELVEEKLPLRGDEEERADLSVAAVDGMARSASVIIQLRDELPPGPYVVMWRALSADGHVVSDHFVFLAGGGAD